MHLRILAAALLVFGIASAAEAGDPPPAKQLFGSVKRPSHTVPAAIGFYSKGCASGLAAVPVDGPAWQVMRLSRNRNWGHPQLVALIERIALKARAEDGWPGLLVGDLSQPRGGPMLTGHASHQVGLDADIWLTPMPDRRLSATEREEMSAVPVVEPGPHVVKPKVWTDAHYRVIRRAAMQPEVERIFVAPGIKKKLCEDAGPDRAWLAKVRPYYGHNYHMHIRMKCPPGSGECRAQDPVGAGDGCGKELAYWYTNEPYRTVVPKKPAKPKRPVTLAELPASCATILAAPAQADALTAREAYAASTGSHAALGLMPEAEPIPAAAVIAAPAGPPPLPRPRPE